MIWSTNYDRLANMTMWTLFFGGRDYAPHCEIDGVNIQDWLLSHFFGAVSQLASAIASAHDGSLLDRVVIGWDSLNEPSEGLIGRSKLSAVDNSQGKMHKGPTTSVLQEFHLGMGTCVPDAEYWVVGALGPSRQGSVSINPKGTKVWMGPSEDVKWQEKWGYKRGDKWRPGQCSKSICFRRKQLIKCTNPFSRLPKSGLSMVYGIPTPSNSSSQTTLATHLLMPELSTSKKIIGYPSLQN